MSFTKTVSEKSVFISFPKTKNTKVFFLSQPSLMFLGNSFISSLLIKYFDIERSAKLTVDYIETGTDFINKDKILKTAENITMVGIIPNRNDYPPLYGVYISFLDDNRTRYSFGRSLESTQDALVRAYGEYLERFYARFSERNTEIRSFPKPKRFALRASSLRVRYLARPLSFQRISSKFPLSDSDLELLESYSTFNSTKNRKELLPRSCLHYNVTQKKFLHQNTSSGWAGGFTQEEAKVSAVYELIERDHFLLYWLSGVSPQKIDINSIPISIRHYLLNMTQRYKLELSILNTSYDCNVFSCVVSLVDSVLLRVAIGSAAGNNVELVIKKALCEALSELHVSQIPELITQLDYKNYVSYRDERITKETRKNFFNLPGGVVLFKQIFLNGEIVLFDDIQKMYTKEYKSKKEELQDVTALFKSLTKKNGDGYNLYFFQQNGKILEKVNYFVYKAYVPSLIKLWLDEPLATPFSDRLLNFARDKGLINFTEKDINMYPHPLA